MGVSKTLVLVIVTLHLSMCYGVVIKDCGSKGAVIVNTSVEPCGSGSVCHLERGKSANISVTFNTTATAAKVVASVHGIIAGVPIPFPIPQSDACLNSGLKCPLAKSQQYQYHASLFVRSSYPKIDVTVQWELLNEAKRPIFCISIPATLD